MTFVVTWLTYIIVFPLCCIYWGARIAEVYFRLYATRYIQLWKEGFR